MKKLLFPLIAICAFVTIAPAQQDTVVEEIVARVNNAIITRADLRRNQERNEQDTRELNLTQEQIEQRDANSLRDLIDQQLLLQKASDLGISADADLIKRLDDIRREMKANSMEDLQKIAEQQGVSFEEFKQNTKNNILTQKVIGSEVGSHVQVTRDETQKFYEEHKAELSRPERVRLSEILIPNDPAAPKSEPGKENALQPTAEQIAAAQARANSLYQQLKAGAKFDELARKESSGTTAAQGGDLGYFKHKDLASELEEKTFGLKTGEFTEPIHTRQGFIILRVTDHIQAGTPTLDQVRDQIMEQLYSQKVQPALREYLTKLREDAYIDIKPGYTDSGASPNQTKLVYTSDTGPKTKQVRSKFGVGHKKTVVVTGADKHHKATTGTSSNTSALGSAKADVDSKEKAELEKKAAAQAAAAKAKADAEEKEKLSHMSKKERERYLAQKKRNAQYKAKLEKQEEKQERKAEKKRKREEAILAWREKENAKAIAKGKTPPYPSKSDAEKSAEPADPTAPPQKKKINWF